MPYFNRQEDTKEYNKIKTSKIFITHALVIDSTWNQSKGILKDPIISGLIPVFYILYNIFIFIKSNLIYNIFICRISVYKTTNKIISILETS